MGGSEICEGAGFESMGHTCNFIWEGLHGKSVTIFGAHYQLKSSLLVYAEGLGLQGLVAPLYVVS